MRRNTRKLPATPTTADSGAAIRSARLLTQAMLGGCLTLMIGLSGPSHCAAQPAPPPIDQKSWADTVLREDESRRLLSTLAGLLKDQQYDQAAVLLQRCFAGREDHFISRPEWSLPGVRGNATHLLHDAGDAAWQAYETAYGIQAQVALDKVEKSGPPTGYYAVIRQFEHTIAGGIAMDRLAMWFFDRGDVDAAVDCWQQLLTNPIHAGRITDQQRLKLLIAAQRCQRQQVVDQVTAALGQRRVSLGGKSATAVEWLASLKLPGGDSTAKWEEWRLLGGSATRSRVTSGSAPFLRPAVAISMFDSGDRRITPDDRFAQVEGRVRVQREIENALATGAASGYAGTPIVKGNLIVWRDVFGISALDRLTRKPVFSHATKSVLHTLLNLNSDQELRPTVPMYSRSSVLEQLTSDGQHVYYIDQNNIQDRSQMQLLFEPNLRNDTRALMPAWNCLTALRLAPGDGIDRVAWQVGGHPVEQRDAPLSGHYFLGPPLPLGGMLYALAEHQKMIVLVALQPESGQVVWRQNLSSAPQPSPQSSVYGDRRRLAPATFLGAGQGVLVCPLGSGVVIGIRRVTGEIAWIQDYRFHGRRRAFNYSGQMHNSIEQSDEAEFPCPPLIHKDRVYLLTPGESGSTDQIFCYDLQTGKKLWQVDTTVDLKYLGSVDDDLLLAVGGFEVMGLLTQQGTVKWTRRVPRISGVGAGLSGLYLLPLAEGRVLSLDPRDGSEVGFSMQVPNIRPGNLVVSGKDVISLNGLDLQIFPQSAELLASLEARPLPQRQSYAYWYELGELQFRIGQIRQAKVNLQKALQLAPGSEAKSSVRNVLRELAWQELNQQPENREQTLAEYAELTETPEQQAQHLLLVGEEQARTGKIADAQQTASSLLQLGVTQPLKVLADPDRRLNASTWVAELSSRNAPGTPAADQLLEGETDFDKLAQRGDRQGLLQLLQRHPNASWSPRLRLLLAELFVQDGRPQAAELLLWQDHLQHDSVGLDASRFLLELWESAGLFEESGHLLHRLNTDLGAVKGSDGLIGQDVYAQYPRTSLAWNAAQRFVPIDWKVANVQISEEHELHENWRSTFNPNPRYLYFPQSSQQLVIRGPTLTNTLQQIDMETGSMLATIPLPPSMATGFFTTFETRSRVGHFLPVGGEAACYGISTLERGLTWNMESTPQFRLNQHVRIGPSTPRICVMRSRDRLFAVDPTSGGVLWERHDLEESNRLIANALTVVPGDSEVVVLMESDSKSYRLFKTSDGSFVRSGQLKDCYYLHHSYGRNLLYSVVAVNTAMQMRSIKLWDPLHEKVMFEATDMPTPVGLSEREPEFTAAAKSGIVRVVDGVTGNVKIEVKLNPYDVDVPQQVPVIKSFTDGTRYYINVNRPQQVLGQSSYSSDALFPTQSIAGDLHAVDPQTSQLIWTRTRLGSQNVVCLPDYRLPFLVSLSRFRDRLRGSSQQLSRVEVIDGETGHVIASKLNCFHNQLLLTDYDRDAGRLRIRGAITQIQLDFGRQLNRHNWQDDEFTDRGTSR